MIVDKLAYTLSLILHDDDIDKIKTCIEFPRNKDHGDITFNTMKYWGLSSSGRAPALHAGGDRFESDRFHQYRPPLLNPAERHRGSGS